MNYVENYINQFAPSNRKICDDIAFGIDMDATLFDNDKANLEVDFAVVNAVIATWLGEEIASKQPEDLQIAAKAKLLVPELTDEAAKARLRKAIAEPDIMCGHVGKNPNANGNAEDNFGAWPKTQAEYNRYMAGKPINALLRYMNRKANLFPEGSIFDNMIEEDIVEDIEVAAISEIVPQKTTATFPFWPETLQTLDKMGITCAVVTSSEYIRALPLFKASGAGKFFGFTAEDFVITDAFMARRKQLRKEWREAVKTCGRFSKEAESATQKLNALKDDLHMYVKQSPHLHLYSAAEEAAFAERHHLPTFERKPHGNIYGVFIKEEAAKRAKTFASGILIEDSGSIKCIKATDEIYKYSGGIFGSDKGESGVNGFNLAIGLVIASHYTNKAEQARNLMNNGAHKIAFDVKEVLSFVRAEQKRLEEESDNSLTAKDNRQALASALARYGNTLSR